MSGIERRLARLEQAVSPREQTMVVFVSFVPGSDLHATATVDARVWHRAPDELEEAFLARVGAEARLARQGNRVLVAFLDDMVAPQPESPNKAAEPSDRRLGLPSFVNVELMG